VKKKTITKFHSSWRRGSSKYSLHTTGVLVSP